MQTQRQTGFWVIGILFCLWHPLFGQADEKKELRVLCYNIHHGAGVDGRLDLERISKVILSVKPDLVALQEVDVKTERALKVDQASKLAELTRMKFAFGKNIEFTGGEYGNCILSRFPIKKSANVLLPNHRNGEQRGILTAIVQPGFLKEPIHFWSTHFDHRREESERIASAEVCNQMLAKTSGSFHILAGDFNATIGSRTIDTLEKSWRRSNVNELPTVPVLNPKRQIDFIWSAKRSKVVCIKTKVLPEAVASDHRAIFAVYRFN